MNTDVNKQLIRDYLDLFAKDRQQALDRYVADPALKEHVVMFDEGLPGYQLHEEDLIAEGDEVVLRCNIVGTHAGRLMGVPATGRNVNIPAIIIYKVAGGRIVQFWAQADALGLLQQIGAVPTPEDAA